MRTLQKNLRVMDTVTAHKAISDLSNKFNVGAGLSFVRDNRFYICKWEYTREDIHRLLSDYFLTHMLEPGWKLILDPVQYIYNEFYLTQDQ